MLLPLFEGDWFSLRAVIGSYKPELLVLLPKSFERFSLNLKWGDITGMGF